jgi:hypothetical protein
VNINLNFIFQSLETENGLKSSANIHNWMGEQTKLATTKFSNWIRVRVINNSIIHFME